MVASGQIRVRISIVVLGDLGRSPRMLYHALSLAGHGVDVDLIGYRGALPEGLAAHPAITCRFLDTPRDLPDGGPLFFVRGAARAVAQAWQLARMLLTVVPRPDAVLVQVPPALPALAIALLAARLRRARLVVDWHNLTASVLALRLGNRHPLVRLVAAYERSTGRRADAHLSVSRAMADALAERAGIAGVCVFHDRPADAFTRAPEPLRQAWRRRIVERTGLAVSGGWQLVVVPTSWGLDDDFEILLAALDRCEALLDGSGASIVVVLTGRGPLRSRYQPLFEQRQARRVHARAIWLTPEEYVELLGCADLGVSAHRSASGLDLPMKICDLFGAGVPVCALDYGPCLAELVGDGVNGQLFSTAEELARQLCDLLTDRSGARLARLRDGAAASAAVRWREGWDVDAWPVLRGEGPR
jgi:beta-1,4-mannosyltransferase